MEDMGAYGKAYFTLQYWTAHTPRYWPFGDPFIEKRKLYERRRKEAEQQLDARLDRLARQIRQYGY